MTLVGFLIAVLILLIVLYVAKIVVDELGLPDNIRKIAMLIIGLIGLIALFNQLGYVGVPMRPW